jgi:hypothetical protein
MMKSILDRTFVYVNSAKTDLRKTFARIRREKREADEREKQAKVLQITKRRA